MEEIVELLFAGGRIRYLGVAAVAVLALPTVCNLLRFVAKAALRTGVGIANEVQELVAEVRAEEGSVLEIETKRAPKVVAVATAARVGTSSALDLEELTVAEFEEKLKGLDLSELLALEEDVANDTRKGIKDIWQKAVDRAHEG
ncbi:MAG: hypothetical protein HY711_09985 [Candidatus Melainabacteria bacterium]|nr:hypothetical protein [Candidatus Melainabacteria bacterium]